MGAVELGCGVAGGDQRFGGERGQQRLQVRVFRRAEQGLCLQRHGGAGFRARGRCRGLISVLSITPLAMQFWPRASRSGLVCPRSPSSATSRRRAARAGARSWRRRDRARPEQRLVVSSCIRSSAVAGELDVNLGGAIAERNAVADRGQRVPPAPVCRRHGGRWFGVGQAGRFMAEVYRAASRAFRDGLSFPRRRDPTDRSANISTIPHCSPV